jgi:lipoate-protein ligase A
MISRSRIARFAAKILITTSHNPHLNLAKELDLLYSPASHDRIFYLWQNSPVVVIGKHQNPYRECNLDFMKKNNVFLARRPTGGGAVYPDLGNTGWTFLEPAFRPDVNTNILVSALKKFGIDAYATGRNDIEVDGKKVSGAAFRRTQYRSIHHGTVLMHVDMKMLTSCLSVSPDKLKAKGVDSVRARVMNLCELFPRLNNKLVTEALVDSYQEVYGRCPVEYTDFEMMMAEKSVKSRYDQLSSQNWLFGRNSNANVSATKRYDFGLFNVTLNLEGGHLKGFIVDSDCLITDVVEKFEDCLNEIGQGRRGALDIEKQTINSMKTSEEKEMMKELLTWIVPEISGWTFSRK